MRETCDASDRVFQKVYSIYEMQSHGKMNGTVDFFVCDGLLKSQRKIDWKLSL